MLESAKRAGRNLLDGFMEFVRTLPSKLWQTLLAAAGKLLNIGTQLWNNAKKAGTRIWEGFKKGIGKSSPSYLERAIDEIAERAAKLPVEMEYSFSKLNNLKVPELEINQNSNLPNFGLGAFNEGYSGNKKLEITHQINVSVDAKDVKSSVNDFIQQLIKALRDPEIYREVDEALYRSGQSRARPIGVSVL